MRGAKIVQRALFLGIGHGPLAMAREHGLPRAKKGEPLGTWNEYDYPPHRKELAKLRLEQPLVLLETPIPWSSTSPPKTDRSYRDPSSVAAAVEKQPPPAKKSKMRIGARERGSCARSCAARCWKRAVRVGPYGHAAMGREGGAGAPRAARSGLCPPPPG